MGKIVTTERMRKEGKEFFPLTIRIDVDTLEGLNEICTRDCINRTALVRRLIENYVRENKNRR